MKKNKIQPQKIIGRRDFDKPGFISNPSKIIFKDFEIGKKMSITIDIVNISYSFNSFHLEPLDDEISYFFDIDYKPCGRIPAGMSSKMTLNFTPLINKDYKSSLKLLSETGICIIPIECYYKKCIIHIENNILDYGNIIIGEEIEKFLIVNNEGAISCKYTITDINNEILEESDIDLNDDEFDKSDKVSFYKNIVVHQHDFIKEIYKCEIDSLNEIKTKKIEEYKTKLINETKENLLKNIKEIDKKMKNKENEISIKLNEIPKEKYDEIELKVKKYSDDFKIENEDKNEYNKLLYINRFNSMKKFILKQIKFPLIGKFPGYSKKKLSFILKARFIGEFNLKCFLKIEYNEKLNIKNF